MSTYSIKYKISVNVFGKLKILVMKFNKKSIVVTYSLLNTK